MGDGGKPKVLKQLEHVARASEKRMNKIVFKSG